MHRSFCIAAIAATALVVTATSASAQRSTRFGMLAGANLSEVSVIDAGIAAGEELLENQRRGGGQAALYATIPLKGRLSLQPELHYVQKGGKASISLPIDPEVLASYASDRMTLGLRLSYAEIPVLARIDLGGGNSWRPFLLAGPSFALKLQCKTSVGIGTFNVSGSCDDETVGPGGEVSTEPTEDPVRSTDVGAIGGVGLQGTLMGRAFSAQLRYSQGLRSIATQDVGGSSAKNRGFALVLGLGF